MDEGPRDGGDGRSSVEVDDGEGEGDEEGGDDVDGVAVSTKKMTEAVALSFSFSFVSLADWSLLILGFLIFQVVKADPKRKDKTKSTRHNLEDELEHNLSTTLDMARAQALDDL
ncbi:hypothetical protein RJT34_12524 [Clitoria ternatea]|uniref:Uncharacterized protein n=1 Tax=Clitoria ternatea TaxID=43366 RepID=A0AAN9PKZ8_CLITE